MEIPERTYFEQHAEELLSNAGINKAKFAELMGIARQNVLKLFETKNYSKRKMLSLSQRPLLSLVFPLSC